MRHQKVSGEVRGDRVETIPGPFSSGHQGVGLAHTGILSKETADHMWSHIQGSLST